jgi:hypothetical protein
MVGVTVVIVVLIISVTVAVITQNSTENNTTTNNTTINATSNNTTVNATNNTTSNNTNSTTSKSCSKKTKNSKSSNNLEYDDDGYYYSGQYGQYIKYWRDSDNNYHLRGKDGVLREDYNTHTGEFTGNSKEYGYEHYYMNPGG